MLFLLLDDFVLRRDCFFLSVHFGLALGERLLQPLNHIGLRLLDLKWLRLLRFELALWRLLFRLAARSCCLKTLGGVQFRASIVNVDVY